MTRVEMIYEGNLPIGFRMEGHAEYNTKGPDILCASLSTASQMTINGVLDWIGIDIDETIKENKPKEAILHFEIPWYFTSVTSNQLFKSFELYLEQLANQYNGYVILERRQKDDM